MSSGHQSELSMLELTVFFERRKANATDQEKGGCGTFDASKRTNEKRRPPHHLPSLGTENGSSNEMTFDENLNKKKSERVVRRKRADGKKGKKKSRKVEKAGCGDETTFKPENEELFVTNINEEFMKDDFQIVSNEREEAAFQSDNLNKKGKYVVSSNKMNEEVKEALGKIPPRPKKTQGKIEDKKVMQSSSSSRASENKPAERPDKMDGLSLQSFYRNLAQRCLGKMTLEQESGPIQQPVYGRRMTSSRGSGNAIRRQGVCDPTDGFYRERTLTRVTLKRLGEDELNRNR